MGEIRPCIIPVPHDQCEEAKRKCIDCPFKDGCDCIWVADLWEKENRVNKDNTLLGPYLPGPTKDNIRQNHIYTYGDSHDNFVGIGVSTKKQQVTIYDLYIDDCARGKGLSRKLLDELQDTYKMDIFAKCVRGTSAEAFWDHVAIREQPTMNEDPNDMYEHRLGKDGKPKRDVAWFRIPYVQIEGIKKNELW